MIIFAIPIIAIAKGKLRPEDTGHIRTAVSVLEDRAEEVKEELRDLEDMLGKGDMA